MIGLILGTTEGRKILSLLNKYTDDLFVSTATSYGGELLKEGKFKCLNTSPLILEELIESLEKNSVNLLVDVSHPYAAAVSKNAIEACKSLNIEYVRYERPRASYNFGGEIVWVKDYEELFEKLSNIDGTILNTTGSRNLEKFVASKLKNRIIHRILPSIESVENCFSLGIKTEDIIAIKGPISYELNCSFIKEYEAKAIILKDSGVEGGTEEKLKAAAHTNIKAFIIDRNEIDYENVFNNEEKLVDYIIRFVKKNNKAD